MDSIKKEDIFLKETLKKIAIFILVIGTLIGLFFLIKNLLPDPTKISLFFFFVKHKKKKKS